MDLSTTPSAEATATPPIQEGSFFATNYTNVHEQIFLPPRSAKCGHLS